MINAIYLYGSKARGDHDRFSDTDLLGVTESGLIQKPFDDLRISFHLYPFWWLEREASSGSLFLLHLVNEARPVFDPTDTLGVLRAHFIYKKSYSQDIEIGARVVASILKMKDDQFTEVIRKRYFWGVRTVLMARAAEMRAPAFSSESLEYSSKIDGIALHIQSRWDATFSECKRFGKWVIDQSGVIINPDDDFSYLIEQGGIAAAAAGDILYGLGASQRHSGR